MSKTRQTLTIFLILFLGCYAYAQQKSEEEQRQEQLEQAIRENGEIPYGWNAEFSLGADVLSNLLINPAVGGGNSRLGISGAADLNLQYKEGLLSWNTQLSINHGIQKNGTGLQELVVSDTIYGIDEMGMETIDSIIPLYDKIPFQKNIDNIWLNSRASLRTSYFSEFYYTADLFFSSQLTRTYDGNYLSDINRTGYPIARFLAPGTLQFSLGMEHRPNDFLSFLLTPASVRFVMVLDDNIADDVARDRDGNVLGTIHGNPYTVVNDTLITFKNTDIQLGASFRMVYENDITERIALKSNLGMFTNYLNRPDRIDINWRNELNISIIEGLKFSLLSLLNYDHDIFVQRSDNNSLGGVNGLGRRLSYTQQ
ncbi:MAG: DUF3078 domain-containing protein, partial [Bacteroidota bacterium]